MRVTSCARVPLPEETVNYLQSLDYELGGLQVLHTHALNAGVEADRLEELRARFREKFEEYQLAKQELFARYGAEHAHCKRWWVDFREGALCVETPSQPTADSPLFKGAKGPHTNQAPLEKGGGPAEGWRGVGLEQEGGGPNA